MKRLFTKYKKRIVAIALLFAVLIGIVSPYQVFASPTGYHTETHFTHTWDDYTEANQLDGDCTNCGNASVWSNTIYYWYNCNGVAYRAYCWQNYWCSICSASGNDAYVIDPGPWKIIEFYPGWSYETFIANLPQTIYCLGYDVANTYDVKYNGNGATSGSMDNTTHTYDTDANLRPNAFSRTGYSFAGWSTSSTATSATYGNTASVKNLTATNGGTVNLYAVWKPNNYTVSFSGNGGSPSYSSKSVTYTGTYGSLPTATRTGYTFHGWYTATSGGSQITTSTTVSTASNHTLYARWTRNAYDVTYDANGGTTSAANGTCYYGDAVNLSPTANKDGYVFIGWNTNPNATKALDSLTMPANAVTLYAIYSIEVSDVANHDYTDYSHETDEEVYLVVYKQDDVSDFRTYPLTYTSDTNIMLYRYTLDSTDVSDFIGNEPYYYQLIAFDNAYNYSVLYSDRGSAFPVPEKYVQTVEHYRYDVVLNEWVWFDTTTKLVLEGTTFTAEYITAPTGYKISHIETSDGNESYVVTGEITSKAYYTPIDYTLTFDANGGECSASSKPITYNDYYGELPTPTRKGYTFTGWYTQPDGGIRISSSDRYTVAGDSTIYAGWKINSYHITYDYWTNGGETVSQETESYNYGFAVDLSGITAEKDGFEFVGWNTDPNATEGLETFVVSDKNETLYAIFKKTIIVSLVEQTDNGTVTREYFDTIYNNEFETSFVIEKGTDWTGWEILGFTTNMDASAYPEVSTGSTYTTSESVTLYAVYITNVTISYDTNGSSVEIDGQTKERYYNASGNYANPSFTIADAPVLEQYSFVEWAALDGKAYPAGQTVEITESTILKASWDEYPELEVYNRYFTLEEAQSGKITKTELLSKVEGTDREDGTLTNGTDVTVLDFEPFVFLDMTENTDIEITYQAIDSFGNVVTKTARISVVNTTVRRSTSSSYVRFINSQFFVNEAGDIVPSSMGGLEETSTWRTNNNRYNLLQRTLLHNKTNVETWIFKQEDIKEMKNYTNTYGHVLNAIDEFFELFSSCKQEES